MPNGAELLPLDDLNFRQITKPVSEALPHTGHSVQDRDVLWRGLHRPGADLLENRRDSSPSNIRVSRVIGRDLEVLGRFKSIFLSEILTIDVAVPTA